MRFPAGTLALLLITGSVCPLEAQILSGRLIDADASLPVASAFVQLLSGDGVRLAGTLTDSAGRFRFPATEPGEYRLSAERLGYETVVSPLLHLSDAPMEYEFTLSPRALLLPSVDAHVDESRGCERRPDGPAVYALWDAVRKALTVTSWSTRTGSLRFSMMNHERELDSSLRTVKREDRTPAYATAALPYGSISPHVLARDGYLITDGDSSWLMGLDADVLLSESFLNSHCFRLVSAPDTGTVGLGFEPLRRDDLADVSGVLWVDRRTAELRRLTFEYVGLPDHIRRFGASGEVDFERMETGIWIITRWWIRAPIVASRRGSRSYRLLGFREYGGTVTSAQTIDSDLYGQRGTGVIEGFIHDSISRGPLASALVFLSGTPFSAVSDSAGHYRLHAIPAGTYAIGFTHPRLEELDISLPMEAVTISGTSVLRRTFATPSLSNVLRALCPGDPGESTTGLVYGVVRREQSGEPLAGVPITAAWKGQPAIRSGARASPDPGPWRVETDEDGRYFMCWLPRNRDVQLRVESADVRHQTLTTALSTEPMLRLDF